MRQHDPSETARNRLIAALPDEVQRRIAPHLEAVRFRLGEVVYESGQRLTHVHFPVDCIVSLLYTMADGATAEIGMVGAEGVVGIALFMGGETMPSRAVVQSAGQALRMPAEALQEEFRRGGPFQLALLRFTQALITQMSQTAACNRLHEIEQRLCRWLLLSRDRLQSDELLLTQELIAGMLGVRREGVSVAAGALQAAGLIRYARGRITILDRAGLEARTCECYRAVRDACESLLA
jgi:CRP-like cAMP-binding protein